MPHLPITIGKTSDSSVLTVNLADLPHLFITYSEREQIFTFFQNIIKCFAQHQPVQYAFAVSEPLMASLVPHLDYYPLIDVCISNASIDYPRTSKKSFVRSLVKEFNRREKAKSLNQSAMVIIVEDIIDLVSGLPPATGFGFLRMLVKGRDVGMHLVGASIRTYSNLMKQLIGFQSAATAATKKKLNIDSCVVTPLGAELIINPEDLYFYKGPTDKEYARYYDISEGLYARPSPLPIPS